MAETKQIRIATYNIQFGINREKIIHNVKKLANEGTSIICIQEVINISGHALIVDEMLKQLGKNWQAAYHIGAENSRLSIGTAILWNTDILHCKREERILLPKINQFALHEKFYYWVIGVPGIPLQRKAMTCYFDINNKTLRVTCLHIDNVGGPLHRIRQLSYLRAQLKNMEKPDYEIICGDFNTFDLLRTGYEKRLLQMEFGKEYQDASKKAGWTSDIYNINFKHSIKLFPWLIKTFNIHIRRRLDYIWIKNMKLIEGKKEELHGSDHYPVVALLEL